MRPWKRSLPQLPKRAAFIWSIKVMLSIRCSCLHCNYSGTATLIVLYSQFIFCNELECMIYETDMHNIYLCIFFLWWNMSLNFSSAVSPDWKNNSEQSYSSLRGWRLSASWGNNWGPSSNPVHYSTIVLRGVRGPPSCREKQSLFQSGSLRMLGMLVSPYFQVDDRIYFKYLRQIVPVYMLPILGLSLNPT